ncbi:hypothetical protein RF11_08147 [Thelohanellus kitauei]|uniref:Uncharacterized protein n=1 Tax=Thelohanellus kitauei TaxID=669202 RepID=A0A0C2MJ98_THEKT|nr:hypothetical protein RF11_08147 [Thelohanellus kitauei]
MEYYDYFPIINRKEAEQRTLKDKLSKENILIRELRNSVQGYNQKTTRLGRVVASVLNIIQSSKEEAILDQQFKDKFKKYTAEIKENLEKILKRLTSEFNELTEKNKELIKEINQLHEESLGAALS